MKKNFLNIRLAYLLITASAMDMSTVIAMSEKHPFSITAAATKKKATVRISGTIWNWHNNAEQFRAQVEKFNADGVNHLHLYINTPGGSVIEANEIVNILRSFNGKITGEGGALVASAGTYIALECETFEMPSNGQFMYHKPMASMRGNEDQIESDLVALKNFTADYKKRYGEKSNLSESQIEKNWSKGDVWLSAAKALKDGFITGIIKSPVKITKDTTALFAACGAPKPPKPTVKKQDKNPKNNNSMNELEALALKLGLPQTSTQAEVDAHLVALQAKAGEADTLKVAAEAKEKTDKANAITAMFAKAVTDKKLNAKQVDGLRAFAEADFDGCQAHIDSLPTLEAISKNIKGKATPSASATSLNEKAFDALTNEEHAQLQEEDPAGYEAKYDAYLEASNK